MALDPNDYATNRGYGQNLDNTGTTVTLGSALGGMNLVEVSQGFGGIWWPIGDGNSPITGMPATFDNFLVSMWIKAPLAEFGSIGLDARMHAFLLHVTGTPSAGIIRLGGHGVNPPGTNRLVADSTNLYTLPAGADIDATLAPTHFLMSCNGVTGQFSLSVNGVSHFMMNNPLAPVTAGSFGNNDWAFGGQDGCLFGDFWASDTPAYVDATDPAIIAKFMAGGLPVDLGTDGSTPFGTQPPIFFSLRSAAAPAVLPEDQVFLTWSDDRGHSYGSPVGQSMGGVGGYRTSLQWRRLGIARDRIFEIQWSVDHPTALQGAWIITEKADS